MPESEESATPESEAAESAAPSPPADTKPDPKPASPNGEKKFSQADLDVLIARRLQEEKDREARRTEDIRRRAEMEAAARSGEWEKVAKGHEARIAELEAQIQQRDREVLLAQVAAEVKLDRKHWHRIQGNTREELLADAKELLSAFAPPSPGNINPGGGGGAPAPKGAPLSTEEQAAALARTARSF